MNNNFIPGNLYRVIDYIYFFKKEYSFETSMKVNKGAKVIFLLLSVYKDDMWINISLLYKGEVFITRFNLCDIKEKDLNNFFESVG